MRPQGMAGIHRQMEFLKMMMEFCKVMNSHHLSQAGDPWGRIHGLGKCERQGKNTWR